MVPKVQVFTWRLLRKAIPTGVKVSIPIWVTGSKISSPLQAEVMALPFVAQVVSQIQSLTITFFTESITLAQAPNSRDLFSSQGIGKLEVN
uniref:Reverse transcriptase zinc-binding domain-containing protein n=1 Tax=Aegilops tauschii TaxID=37682 RepID=M8BCL6_AEGTA